MSAFIDYLKDKLSHSDVGSAVHESIKEQLADATSISNLMKSAMEGGMDVSELDPQGLWKQIFKEEPDDYISDDTLQGVVDKINCFFDEDGIKPIKLNFDSGSIQSIGKDTAESWKAAAQAIQSVGGAMQTIEDPAAKIAGIVAQAIATVASAYAQALANIWTFIAAAAASTASMIATIASIHSATGYSEGGIVQGNAYSGDNVGPVMLDAGELILNRSQQSNIASALSESENSRIGNVSMPYVTGEKIVLGINNWARRNGRGELVFSR